MAPRLEVKKHSNHRGRIPGSKNKPKNTDKKEPIKSPPLVPTAAEKIIPAAVDNTATRMEKKNEYVLSIGDGTIKMFVQDSEKEIERLNAFIDELKPGLSLLQAQVDESRQFLESAQSDFNDIHRKYLEKEKQIYDIGAAIEKRKNIIKGLKEFNKVDGAKKIKWLTNEMKPSVVHAKAPKRVKWLEEALNVLSEQNRAMGIGDLVDLILKKPHVAQAVKSMRSPINSIKSSTIDNMIEHANTAGRDRRNGSQYLFIHNEKVGAIDWMDFKHSKPGRAVPKAEYVKFFMG
jgi:hypothetical protein